MKNDIIALALAGAATTLTAGSAFAQETGDLTAAAEELTEVSATAEELPAEMAEESGPGMARGDIGVGLGLSVFGVALEGSYQPDPMYRVRGVWMGGVNLDYSENDATSTVSGSLDLGGLMLMGDLYPFRGGLHLSGGVFLSNTEVSATGTVTVDDGLGGTITESVTTSLAFVNAISPTVTAGYDMGFFGTGASLSTEVGVVFTGGLDLSFDTTDPTAQSEVDNDPDIKKAISDAESIGFFPFIGVGLTYEF